MKILYLYRFLLALIMFSCTAMPLLAKSVECREKITEYLDEKTAFCVSKSSLMQYRNAADMLDLEAMNELVFSGQCNFIPDGEYLPLQNYTYHVVGSVSLIAIEIEDITIWSLADLVSGESPDRNGAGGGSSIVAALADTGFAIIHCP